MGRNGQVEGPDPVLEAARILRERGDAIALTGAGISVESGIPAFRGSQGLWEKYDPAEYASIGSFVRNPARVWKMLEEMIRVLERAAPNRAHEALAELERMGILRGIITQNIDGLHQAAGSRKVIEFHGNAENLVCIACWRRYPSRERIRGGIPPRCDCGEILKPDVVFFGEPIPWPAQDEAEAAARSCRVLLVVGTSAQVFPACDIPRLAKRNGACVVEINPEETSLTGTTSDWRIPGKACDVIPRLVALARGK